MRLDCHVGEEAAGQRIGLGGEVEHTVHLAGCLRIQGDQLPLEEQRADPAEGLAGTGAARPSSNSRWNRRRSSTLALAARKAAAALKSGVFIGPSEQGAPRAY